MLDLNFNSYKKVIFFNIIIHNYSFTIIFSAQTNCFKNKFSALQTQICVCKAKNLFAK